jgi:hypothetical protein
MAALGLVFSGVGVGDQAQVADDLAQPTRIQAAGRLDQDRLGVDGDLGGELVGAVGQNGGVSWGEVAVGQGLGRLGQGTPEQDPGGTHAAVGRTSAHPQPGPEPAGGRAGLDIGFGPGGAAGVQVGEFVQPVAFQAVHQPPQLKDPFGLDRIREPVQVLVGQLLDHRGQGH